MNLSDLAQTSIDLQIFQAMPGNSIVLLPNTPVFTIVAATDDYYITSGRNREELTNIGMFNAFPSPPDDPDHHGVKQLRTSLEKVITQKAADRMPLVRYDIANADGTFDERWWSAINKPVLGKNAEVQYIIHTAEEMTLQVRAEESANRIKSLVHSHNLFMQAPVTIGIVKGREYIIELANDSLLEIWGRPADVVGKPVFDAIPELNSQGYRELLDQVLQTGEPFYGYEHPIRLNRGGKEEVLYFDFVYKPYYEGGYSRPVGVFMVGHNVTEQVKVRQKVQESEDLFRSFSDNIQNLAWITDGEGWIYWYNRRWYDYTGTTLDEMQGWGWEKVHHPDHIEKVVSFLKDAWNKAEPWELTFPLRGADGIYRWFLTRAVPVTNDQGNIIRWIGTNTNVDEQVQAQEALKERERELQRIFSQAPVSMVVYKGKDLIVQVASQVGLDLWGKTEEEVIGRPFFDISPELREGQEALFRQVWETGEPFVAKEFPVHYIKHGKEHFIYYDFVFQPLRNENGNIIAVVSIGNNVTHSVMARKKIEESEIRFRTLAEALPQMIWMRNMEGVIEFGSKNWERYSGISDVSEAWQAMAHPEDWKAIMGAWEQSVVTNTPFRYEVRLKNKEGEYRWHNASGEPLKDENGNVIKWIGALTDVHEQKTFAQKLERIVQDRTMELQRSNEDLQQFAHVASHDLKEPVRKVLTFCSLLKEELGKDVSDRAATYLSKIERASVRMYAMIDGVLLYSSINALEQTKELIDLEEVIENIQSDLEIQILEKEAAIKYQNLPSVEGSAILIYQLFYNLVNNSLKFARDGVPPVVELAAEKATTEELIKAGVNNKKYYVKLRLQDNGIGFGNDDAKKIFGTFTRLHAKDKYEGTGLGLSLCRKIVERHGGAIWAEGEQGVGATFTILLPES